MKAKFRLHLDELSAFVYSGIPFYIEFNNVNNYVDLNIQDTDNLSITINQNTKQIDMWYTGGGGETITSNFESISTNGSYIEFDATCNDVLALKKFVDAGIIEFNALPNDTLIYLYKQNNANNVVNKNIILIDIISGQFNHSIAFKTLNVDVVNIPMNFNYVYIPSLNRYYYVDSVEIVSNDIRRLHLREDVLMTWQKLIKQQTALITRKQSGSNSNVLIDDRLPLEDKLSYDYFKSLTMLDGKNITFDYETKGKRFCSLSFTNASTYIAILNDIQPPVNNSGLPTIQSHMNYQTCMAFFPYITLYELIKGLYADSSKASYIENLMWLPFDPLFVFDTLNEAGSYLYCGDKVLGVDGTWITQSQAISQGKAVCQLSQTMGSPYLVLADFTFNSNGGIDITNSMLMQNSYWEIYIPFVGWVPVTYSKVYNKRIWIYYTIDMKTGISTAYIYNFTDKIVLYSATCTLGVKVDFSTSNQLENTRQKQANDLNMLIGGLSSAISIGVGIASENPVAIAGGVLSFGKQVVSYVNSNNMLIERANTSFGTSDGALYSPLEVCVRRSYHKPISIDNDVYASMQGYPTNTYSDLQIITGYTEIGEIHFDPKIADIYQDEITEIVSLLKDGVIF